MNLLKAKPILLILAHPELIVYSLTLLQIYPLSILKYLPQNAQLSISELEAKVVLFLKGSLLGHGSLLKTTAVQLAIV